ncbi:MAG TPA: hypothetical protein VG164_04410 [Trebonia sp.]|jgi:hypothetical protein|nr:hypothetical protein [Trebonia sp.]
MATELQVRLTGLAAPAQFVDWARPFPDLESCWDACDSPEFLLWLAARACRTAEERRAIVSCLAALTRQAERGRHRPDPPVERAASTAETWTRAGGAGLDDLLAAERDALDAAERAAVVAAAEGARARMLVRSAPRGRHASLRTGRALGALAGWRDADQALRLALAAAGTARAAAEAAQADAAAANGATPPPGEPAAPEWEARVSESARYVLGALAHSQPPGQGDKATRKAARLIRRRLPCPRLD